MSKQSQHVVKDGDGWAVKKEVLVKQQNTLIRKKKRLNMEGKLLKTKMPSFTFMAKMGKFEKKTVMEMIHVHLKIRSKDGL